MQIRILLFLLLATTAGAQPRTAPGDEPVGPSRGVNSGNYNVVNSFEGGYRFHSVSGNRSSYRSQVNYGNGIRLLGSNFSLNSRDGKGRLVDEITLTTFGLGNDPYQSANLRILQNRWYRYDLLWRSVDYVNPGLTTGTSQGHFLDTRRTLQDHDITLFPQSRARVIAGYSRAVQDGPGLTTLQLFDSRGDEYALFSNIDRRQSEYRLGGEINLRRFKFLALHGRQRYEETTAADRNSLDAGANTRDNNTLTSLRRAEPYQGDTPFWRFSLNQEGKTWYAISARFSHATGRRDFTLDELAGGTDRLGIARTRQVSVAGRGRRPVSTGSVTLSLFPAESLTLTNHLAFHQTRMEGDNVYREINNTTLSAQLLRFQYLGIRTFANATTAQFRPARWIALSGGYQFTSRRIQSRESETVSGFTDRLEAAQTNRLHAANANLRLHPGRPWTILVDTEIGRADRPIYPVSERNFHVLGARIQYRAKAVKASVGSRADYNTNSSSLLAFASRGRTHSADLSWSPRTRIWLDASYAKLHRDSLAGIAFFAGGDFVDTSRSLYISNLHTGYLSARIELSKRAEITAGYTRVRDSGDGRTSSGTDAFVIAQTFPITYDAPLARISVRLHEKVRWNFGYQYYRYAEDFSILRDYRAHTGYTSLLWSF